MTKPLESIEVKVRVELDNKTLEGTTLTSQGVFPFSKSNGLHLRDWRDLRDDATNSSTIFIPWHRIVWVEIKTEESP